jgi:hypothetical protein
MTTATFGQVEQSTVLAQLKAASPRIEFFVGSADAKKSYSKQEMIQHVETLDAVGKEFIRTQMEFLRSIKTGELQQILMAP